MKFLQPLVAISIIVFATTSSNASDSTALMPIISRPSASSVPSNITIITHGVTSDSYAAIQDLNEQLTSLVSSGSTFISAEQLGTSAMSLGLSQLASRLNQPIILVAGALGVKGAFSLGALPPSMSLPPTEFLTDVIASSPIVQTLPVAALQGIGYSIGQTAAEALVPVSPKKSLITNIMLGVGAGAGMFMMYSADPDDLLSQTSLSLLQGISLTAAHGAAQSAVQLLTGPHAVKQDKAVVASDPKPASYEGKPVKTTFIKLPQALLVLVAGGVVAATSLFTTETESAESDIGVTPESATYMASLVGVGLDLAAKAGAYETAYRAGKAGCSLVGKLTKPVINTIINPVTSTLHHAAPYAAPVAEKAQKAWQSCKSFVNRFNPLSRK